MRAIRMEGITPRVAGAAYLVASAGFILVFGWLASHFGYPDVLRANAADVLPKLLALGGTGRAVWVVYAVLPLLLVPAALGAARALRHADDGASPTLRVGTILQVLAALSMTAGLARWSTMQWSLAERWPSASEAERALLGARFDTLNLVLGNGVGEFAGELFLYGSFVAFALALHRRGHRALAVLGGITAIGGWIGMFRNLTPVVQPAADVTNVLLPLFLIALGTWLVRWRAR